MRTSRIPRLLFALLIAIGLAIAPFGTPSLAGERPSESGMMQMGDMAGDMPCCPDKQKQNDCQDCPLLAICLAKVLQAEPSTVGSPIRIASTTLLPADDPVFAGLVRPPPDQPPRTTV